MHKVGQSGGLLSRLLGPLPKPGLPLMKNMFRPLAKSVLIALVLTAAASAKKMFGSGQQKMLTKQLKVKQQNKKADFSLCY